MSEPKKQHYVPQTYLKNFAFGNEKSSSLYVLSLSSKKVYQSNIRDTAAKRDFYTISNATDKYIWEKIYADRIEPMLGNLLKSIRQRCENVLTQNHSVILNFEEKVQLSLSMIFQLLRGKQTRKYEKQLYNILLPVTISKTRSLFSPLSDANEEALKKIETSEKYFKEIAMEVIFREKSIKLYLNFMIQRSFLFYKINGDNSFVTSDNPVMFMNSHTKEVTPFANGLASISTLVCFPISPKLLLVAYHPEFFFGTLMNKDCCLEILDSDREKHFVDTQNRKQQEQCDNYVYAKSKENLEQLLENL